MVQSQSVVVFVDGVIQKFNGLLSFAMAVEHSIYMQPS